MKYEFETFCCNCQDAYNPHSGKADVETVRQNLEKLLRNNPEFVEKECGRNAKYGINEIFKDPKHGFIVYTHIIEKGRTSPPHDHGASWAVYGQARKHTAMTEYRRLDDTQKNGWAEIAVSKQYRLEPGMVGKFGPHEIHQIRFEDNARFIRVTGSDLFVEKTLVYDIANHSVKAVGKGY